MAAEYDTEPAARDNPPPALQTNPDAGAKGIRESNFGVETKTTKPRKGG